MANISDAALDRLVFNSVDAEMTDNGEICIEKLEHMMTRMVLYQ